MSDKARVEIDVFPDVALSLRDMLHCIHRAMYAETDEQKLTCHMSMACGMAMAVVDDICKALPPEATDD